MQVPKELLRKVPNLDASDLADETFRISGLTVKQSLGNVLRLLRPLVVIDEGHKAYSEIALQTLAGFNPRFLLELSATPNSGKEYLSNVLVNVSGTALKDEQMIKLPITSNDGQTKLTLKYSWNATRLLSSTWRSSPGADRYSIPP